MKRQAAVLGPTPPFIYWAVELDCALKSDIDARDPEVVERALRPLKLTSEGKLDQRSVEDYVYQLRPDGIHILKVSEVTAIHGPWEDIEKICCGCPANVACHETQLVAGCFGWLAMDQIPNGLIDQTIAGSQQLQRELESLNLLGTDPAWFGLWRKKRYSPVEAAALRKVFEVVGIREEHATGPFVHALRACECHDLFLAVRSFPAGHSDGQAWVLEPHCPDCQATMSTSSDRCGCCGRVGHAHPLIKRKVRGYRPFVHLEQIADGQDAERIATLIQRHELNRKQEI